MENATREILDLLVSCRALNSSGFANLLTTCGKIHSHLRKLVLAAYNLGLGCVIS